MVVEAEMSQQRLSNIRFSNKRNNQWAVDLNTSAVYAASGDQLLDLPLFKGSRKADSLNISSSAVRPDGLSIWAMGTTASNCMRSPQTSKPSLTTFRSI
jgi:hypothetical protein